MGGGTVSKRKQRRLTAKELEFLAAHELMHTQARKLLGVSRGKYTTTCNDALYNDAINKEQDQ
jgi:hypothetical protein